MTDLPPYETFTGHIFTTGPDSGTGRLQDGAGEGFGLVATSGMAGSDKALYVSGRIAKAEVYAGTLFLTGNRAGTLIMRNAWGWTIDLKAERGEVDGVRALVLTGTLGPTPIHERIEGIDCLETGRRGVAKTAELRRKAPGRRR